jgi:exopolysaccharide biosynthesis protein
MRLALVWGAAAIDLRSPGVWIVSGAYFIDMSTGKLSGTEIEDGRANVTNWWSQPRETLV